MSIQDTVADMLTRVRNGIGAGHKKVDVKSSKLCVGIANVLKQEGYIEDFSQIEDTRQGLIRVTLKYGPAGERVIERIDRVSRPGRRVYRPADDLPRVLNGLGICIVSTSQGILSDRECRKRRVGGEVLCAVS